MNSNDYKKEYLKANVSNAMYKSTGSLIWLGLSIITLPIPKLLNIPGLAPFQLLIIGVMYGIPMRMMYKNIPKAINANNEYNDYIRKNT